MENRVDWGEWDDCTKVPASGGFPPRFSIRPHIARLSPMRPCRLAEQCCFPRHLLAAEIPPDSGEFPPIGGWHRLERWVAPIGKVGGTDWKNAG